LALVTWRTPLVRDIFGDAVESSGGYHWAFFSTSLVVLVSVVGLVRNFVPSVPRHVAEHLQRQEEVEAFFAGAAGQAGAATAADYAMCSGSEASSSARREADNAKGTRRRNWWFPTFQRDDWEVRRLWESAQRVR